MTRSLTFAAAALATAIASAASAQDLTIWWTKGFYPEEDQALERVIKLWETQTGKKAELTFTTIEGGVPRAVAALSAGNPPDVSMSVLYDFQVTGKWAYENVLEDISDVMEPIKGQFFEGSLEGAYLFNNATKKKSWYAVPTQQQVAHIHYWADWLAEIKLADKDIPREWNAFWNFWCDKVQVDLRKTGKRTYGVGHTVSASASDTIFHFMMFLSAYGVELIDKEGKFLGDQPQVRAGIIKAIDDYTSPYRRKCTPPGSVNWLDADNNVNFLNRITAMTPNPTLSIPASQITVNPDNYNKNIRTMEWPDGPGGRPIEYYAAVKTAVVFRTSKNKENAKSFLRFLARPENIGPVVEGSLGRWFPTVKANADRPFWTDTKDQHKPAAHKQFTQRKIRPFPMIYNWRYAQLQAENVWGKAIGRIVVENWSNERAVDEAIARIKDVLASSS
jgi:multiple sugar transport system substrate-binding protein